MQYKDYYKILGVERSAKDEEIKRAYRKLARKYHPDVSKEPNAEERFKDVQEAYEALKDSQKRAAYDQLGSNWQSGQDFRPPPNWQGFAGGGSGFEEADLGDFSDFFSNIFGGQHRGSHRGSRPFKQRGQDARARIAITLEEAYHGGAKAIQLQTPELDNEGRVYHATHTLKVNIPAGVTAGQQLRLANQGSPGMGGAPSGDLYLEIDILPHRIFTIQERDVYLTLPITPWEAALGGKITVPTLGSAVDMKIAPGSQAGQKLRLKGKGLPNKRQPGDQYVIFQIVTPPVHNDKQRAIYEQMAKEMPYDPRKILF